MSKAHCLMGKTEWVEEKYGFLSDEWVEATNSPSASCMLEDGHKGEHNFIPDNEIMVTFTGKEDN